jgi:hypothetical protein
MCKAQPMQVPLPADADKRANLAAAGTGSGQCVEGVNSGSAPICRFQRVAIMLPMVKPI